MATMMYMGRTAHGTRAAVQIVGVCRIVYIEVEDCDYAELDVVRHTTKGAAFPAPPRGRNKLPPMVGTFVSENYGGWK